MIKLKIKNKSPEKFYKKLNKNNINIYDIRNSTFKINDKDLEKTIKLKTIYDIEVIDKTGFKSTLKKINKIFLASIFFSLLLIILLSNIIFKIEIVTDNKHLQKIIKEELKENGIIVHHLKKNSKKIKKIERNILKKHKDKIEWISIINTGTKYTIKLQSRIISKPQKQLNPRDLVAKKNAVILKIESSDGQILKEKGNYVLKGETIISGSIKLNEETKKIIPAKGRIYGEVWYQLKVEYPYIYYNQINTKQKKYIKVKFLNHQYYLFEKPKQKNKEIKKKSIFTFPFEIGIFWEKERKNKSTILTVEEMKEQALKTARNKINNKLKKNEHIIHEKELKETLIDSKIVLEMFYSVYEDITDYKDIVK
ncbi:MAG: sporulation protein YqfD [Bacilli bacterium]